jgi:hypothetical protein
MVYYLRMTLSFGLNPFPMLELSAFCALCIRVKMLDVRVWRVGTGSRVPWGPWGPAPVSGWMGNYTVWYGLKPCCLIGQWREGGETVPFWGAEGRSRLKLEWECMGKKGFVCALWNCFVYEVLMEMLRQLFSIPWIALRKHGLLDAMPRHVS